MNTELFLSSTQEKPLSHINHKQHHTRALIQRGKTEKPTKKQNQVLIFLLHNIKLFHNLQNKTRNFKKKMKKGKRELTFWQR